MINAEASSTTDGMYKGENVVRRRRKTRNELPKPIKKKKRGNQPQRSKKKKVYVFRRDKASV